MLSILIVEDDITFSLMLTTWLGKKGFVVRSSSSVSDAKRRLGEEAFDLVISDLRLPDSDGIDLLKWLKSTHPSLPLIMMTSYAEIQTAVQAMKLGAAAHHTQKYAQHQAADAFPRPEYAWLPSLC